MGLGVALVVAVLVIHGVIDQSFRRGAQGYDLIVGAKGSPLQLVLNTVFHLERSRSKHPLQLLRGVERGPVRRGGRDGHAGLHGPRLQGLPRRGHHARHVRQADVSATIGSTRSPRARISTPTSPSRPSIGATAARKLKLKVGDTFRPAHPGDNAGETERSDTITRIHGRRHSGADRHAERPGDLHQPRRLLSHGLPQRRPNEGQERSCKTRNRRLPRTKNTRPPTNTLTRKERTTTTRSTTRRPRPRSRSARSAANLRRPGLHRSTRPVGHGTAGPDQRGAGRPGRHARRG